MVEVSWVVTIIVRCPRIHAASVAVHFGQWTSVIVALVEGSGSSPISRKGRRSRLNDPGHRHCPVRRLRANISVHHCPVMKGRGTTCSVHGASKRVSTEVQRTDE